MAAADDINRVFREFTRYTGDGKPGEPINAPLPVGDPQSGTHSPKKAEIRQALGELVSSVDAAVEDAEAARDVAISAAGATLAQWDSRTAAASASIPQVIKYVRVAGYSAAGDGGDALYKRVATQPAHTGKFQSVDGAWWELAEDLVNVKMFGAVGNGIADDTAAIQAAINASSNVFVPRGAYRVTQQLLAAGKPVSIRGEGPGITRLICSVPTGVSAILIVTTSGDHFFNLDGFTMECAVAPVANQYAIHVTGIAQIGATASYNGKKLTAEREKRRGRIANIDFKSNSASATYGWWGGLRVTSLLNFSIAHCSFWGNASNFAREAYAIDGDGVPCDIRCYDLYAYNCQIAFNMPDYVEAVYIQKTEFINVIEGILCGKYQAGRSVLASAALCGSSAMRIGPSHVACSKMGVDLRNAPWSTVTDMMIVLMPPQGATDIYAIYVGTSNFVTVANNCIFQGAYLPSTGSFGVTLVGVANSSVYGNKGQGLTYTVYMSGADGNHVHDNAGFSGGGNVVAAVNGSDNNLIGPMFGGGFLSDAVANFVERRTYADAPSGVTLTATQFQSISIAVPGGVLPDTPIAAMLTGPAGTRIQGNYNRGASTKASLVFSVYTTDASAIAAGPYNFSLIAVV